MDHIDLPNQLPPDQAHAYGGMPIEELLSAGWVIRPPFYHPRTGQYFNRCWIHVEGGFEGLAVSTSHYGQLLQQQIPGARHHQGHLWEGEHENNGPSWTGPGMYADEPGAWSLSTREIYEFIDPTLPYERRFRTLRYELRIFRAGDGDPYEGDHLGVIPLSAERWYALAEMALAEGRLAAAAGL